MNFKNKLGGRDPSLLVRARGMVMMMWRRTIMMVVVGSARVRGRIRISTVERCCIGRQNVGWDVVVGLVVVVVMAGYISVAASLEQPE